MAIFRLSAQIITRGKGQSAVAAAAYRSRSKLQDTITQQVQDYSPKAADLLFAGIYAPKDAPAWAQDREQLWNEVERNENRRNSQLAREIQLALPHELTDQQQRHAVQDFVRDHFVRKGLIADVAIHRPHEYGDDRNVHAHILVTLRQVGAQGWAQHKQRDGKRDELEVWREQWARTANRHLERHGHEARIDHRSLEGQGSERIPQIHLGKTAAAMEREGVDSDRGDQLCRIAAGNAARRSAGRDQPTHVAVPSPPAEKHDTPRRALLRDFSVAAAQLGRTMAALLLRIVVPQDDTRTTNRLGETQKHRNHTLEPPEAAHTRPGDRMAAIPVLPRETLLERLQRERPNAVQHLRELLPMPVKRREQKHEHEK